MNANDIFRALPPVTKNLIIINFIVWLAMMVLPARLGVDIISLGGLHYFGASDFNPVQLFTYIFGFLIMLYWKRKGIVHGDQF